MLPRGLGQYTFKRPAAAPTTSSEIWRYSGQLTLLLDAHPQYIGAFIKTQHSVHLVKCIISGTSPSCGWLAWKCVNVSSDYKLIKGFAGEGGALLLFSEVQEVINQNYRIPHGMGEAEIWKGWWWCYGIDATNCYFYNPVPPLTREDNKYIQRH